MNFKIISFTFLAFIILTSEAYASSNYILPYPSAMPGSIFYKINLVKDYILKFWYFGDFGGFTYNLKESDKYLVEAKTLYEYNQFLLATSALKKSDDHFLKSPFFLQSAKRNGKDIKEDSLLFKKASLKHVEVLQSLEKELSEKVIWKPENSKETVLYIRKDINNSIAIREKYL